MNQRVVLSGCSGGGKSTLLAELKRRGHRVVEEPGRRIIAEERSSGGAALPWVDLVAFARRAIGMAEGDWQLAADAISPVFFDRCLVDAAAALAHATGEATLEPLQTEWRYHHRVFLTPPWPEIFAGDGDRRHALDEAVAEYERLIGVYPLLGYEIVLLPRLPVAERADFLLAGLVEDRIASNQQTGFRSPSR